jgi:hypothetical protein
MDMKRDPATERSAKTARFASVVASCGQPEIVDLWTGPDEDLKFMKAQGALTPSLSHPMGEDARLVRRLVRRSYSEGGRAGEGSF